MKLLAIIVVGVVCIATVQYKNYTDMVTVVSNHLLGESRVLSTQVETLFYVIKRAASDLEEDLENLKSAGVKRDVLNAKAASYVRSSSLFDSTGQKVGQSYVGPVSNVNISQHEYFKQFSVEGRKELWYSLRTETGLGLYYAKAIYNQGFFQGVLVLELNTDTFNYRCSNILFEESANLVASKSRKVIVGCGLDRSLLDKDTLPEDIPLVDGLHYMKHNIVSVTRAPVDKELYAVSIYDTTLMYEKAVVRMFVGIIIYILSILSAVYVSNKKQSKLS